MEILTDLHCHTLASAHAYSTAMELVQCAREKGLEAIALTDHGITMEDAPHPWHFVNIKAIPKEISGVRVLKGCETNIAEPDGTLDMAEELLKPLDIVIASIHDGTYHAKDAKEHTDAYLGALENPYVDIIGHSNRQEYPYAHEPVLLKAKALHKMIEINSSYCGPRHVEMAREIAKKCKELGVHITVDSDAHFCTKIGEVSRAVEMLREIEFPQELIANRSLSVLKAYLAPRKTI